MASDDKLNKTEPATPKRREEAREQGQVAKSKELASVAVLLANCLVLMWLGGQTTDRLAEIVQQMLGSLNHAPLDVQGVMSLAEQLTGPVLMLMVPFLIASVAATFLANVGQTGWLFTFKPLTPSWEKINPVEGVKKLVSKQAMGELVKAVLKIVLIGLVAYQGLSKHFLTIISLANGTLADVGEVLAEVSIDILWRVIGLLVVLSALDYFFQLWLHEENLKMSPDEVKEEFKQREGDPKVKSRIRRMQRELTRQRLAVDVPTADVVITNPRNLAVALKYEATEMNAPVVVAKGAGHLAAMIRKIARRHSIPVVENRLLARALYKAVEVGDTIPYHMYQAVAEVLAYIFWLRKRN